MINLVVHNNSFPIINIFQLNYSAYIHLIYVLFYKAIYS